MKARTILIGCAVIVVVLGGLVIIGGIITIKRISASVPLQKPAALLDKNSAAIAVMRLEPDDPLVETLLNAIPDLQLSSSDVVDLLPMHFVWTAHRSLEENEGHTIRMSIEPKGRLIGMLLDFALWQVSGDAQVAREEYNDEGITSFPNTPIPGFLFVRGNTVVWSSDIETARMAVDGVSPDTSDGPNLRALLPADGEHLFYGALGNVEGSLERSLALFPGGSLDIQADEAQRLEAVSFAFDSAPEDSLSGNVVLHFDRMADASTQRRVAEGFAERLAGLSRGELLVTVEPSYDDSAVLVVSVTGLSEIERVIKEAARKARDLLEALDQGVIVIDP